MFKLYEEAHPDHAISRWSYDQEIKALGLSFKEPKNDTYKTCDQFQIQLKCATTELKKTYAKEQLESHLNMANAPYSMKATDKQIAKSSDGRIIVTTFDLQQCLPTPSLPTGQIFYSRQLWTFNLTCHRCTDGHTRNECDSDHSAIERTKRRTQHIYIPRDYYNIV
ncbi:uncharacterized protein LOC135169138 [Diachasmimorpha longicaudata]|uniref:uncharacterized protein LOC135169138 n=1 Tax=Diachasmimorpha longicaudata TaxID=58733 RepID=UPI0030B8D006